MKPDFIEGLNEDDIKVHSSEESKKPTKVVFSCITQLEENLIKRSLPIFLKNLGPTNNCKFEYEYIRSAYETRYAFFYIGFPEEFFTIKDLRIFIKKLCELLRTDACTLIFNSKGKHFFKDMLSNDNLKAHPNDIISINKQFELQNNDNHNDINIRKYIQGLTFYLCNSLLIRDIDVPIHLPNEVVDYASDITNKGINSRLYFPYPEDDIHHMMLFKDIKPNLPILLKKDMPEYKELWGDAIDGRYIPEGKVLGYYKRDDTNFKGPQIVLGPKEIEKSAIEKGIPFQVLFSKVLVHELAHAFMDKYRVVSEGQLIYEDINANWPISLEARAMEESLANKITLDWFKKYAPEDLEKVKQYMEKQSAFYHFGIYQEIIDADWEKWRESTKKSTPKLIEWFNYCFSDGKIKEPIEYTKKIYDKAF